MDWDNITKKVSTWLRDLKYIELTIETTHTLNYKFRSNTFVKPQWDLNNLFLERTPIEKCTTQRFHTSRIHFYSSTIPQCGGFLLGELHPNCMLSVANRSNAGIE